ncbi:MAG: hypothetical protein GQ535_07130 [Rhodobacteraceae bacterium]|nr:hypothetical protein [Paracoccaceae bacterium]
MLFSRLTLALCMLLGLVFQAAAQPAPQYGRSQLAVGATYSWESSQGLYKGISLGFDGQDYRFKVTNLTADGHETDSIYGTNQQGRLVWHASNGNTDAYQPHDCSFLEGRCESQILRNGKPHGNTFSTAYFQSGIWIHIGESNISDQVPYTSYACGIYDQDSIIQALYIIYSDTDTPFWMRITSGPNVGRSREMLARVTAACQNAQPNT